MTPFEYVIILISIILGLGITRILTGVADFIHKSSRVTVYWPHLIWILFVLLLHIQEWWLLYELKDYHPWRLPVFLFIIAYPINLFVLARMLFPFSIKGRHVDLKLFYFQTYRKFFLLFVVSAVLSILYNIFILGLALDTQVLQGLLVAGFLLVIAKRFSQEWIHKSLAVIILSALVISIIVEWNVWLIG